MRAIMARHFGGPDVLELVELDQPVPSRGQVSIEVTAIGVGWLDTLIRAGQGPAEFPVQLPYIPGSAVAGTVIALGAEVEENWLGARLVTHSVGGYGGGYADTVVADANPELAFRIPRGMDPAIAVALIDDAATALALLEKTPIAAGDRVLIAPGLGGLGHLAVQLARRAGAHVIAAVRGPVKLAHAQQLAGDAVDYAQRDWPDHVREITGGQGVDVVFDGIGGQIGGAAAGLIVDGGRFSGYGMTSGAQTIHTDEARRRLEIVDMAQLPEFWPDTPRRVTTVLDIAAAGSLSPVIGATYPLTEAATAHADIEARRLTGKVLLTP